VLEVCSAEVRGRFGINLNGRVGMIDILDTLNASGELGLGSQYLFVTWSGKRRYKGVMSWKARIA
jgi:hypothetical protein